jgi:hypothetical protein
MPAQDAACLKMAPDSPIQHACRSKALEAMNSAGVEYVVGGAYAMREYAQIFRDTKDLDLFCARKSVLAALDALAAVGFRTEVTDPVWLAKGFHSSGEFVDVICSSGNGVADVDEHWFSRARPTHVLGVPCLVTPPEEIIWSRAFVLERERYDGADVNHILKSCAPFMNWEHLYRRFEPHPEVLLSHLVLYRFAYPDRRKDIPAWLMELLFERCRDDSSGDASGLCRGTLLSRCQYQSDLDEGLIDARPREVRSFREHRQNLL